MIRKKIIQLTSSFLLFSLAITVNASVFDPNYIINDQEILDSQAMTLAEIEQFLNNQGGYISKNSFPNFEGKTKSSAQIIYEASARNYDCDGITLSENPTEEERKNKCEPITINPKFLLVLLQKEQSLLTAQNPSQSQLDWAMGYGCFDGQACNEKWRGFGKQVNSAALQFYDYMRNPHHYPYLANREYTVSNTGKPDSIIRPQNQATASLYNYTPHVYNGNYNFFNLWMKYFTRSYPNGSLVQVKGEAGIWLIQDGKKRPFTTKVALTSRFDINKVIEVNKSDLDSYPKGTPINLAQYSLVRSPRGTIFLIVDDTRRGFDSAETFRKIGFNPEEVVNATWPDLTPYKEGTPITASSSYLTGALLQDKSSGGVYYVSDGTKAPLLDAIFLKTKYKNMSITQVDSKKLDSYKKVDPVNFSDGELLTSDTDKAVYVIENGKKRAIPSAEIFESLGYKWKNIIKVPTKILNLFPIGEVISL